MREIKFRGKSKQTGVWLYGCLITGLFENSKTKEDCPIIVDTNQYPNYDCLGDFDDMDCDIDPLSVGQFTGLTDKNGVEIYEGDVFEAKWQHGSNTGVISYSNERAAFVLNTFGGSSTDLSAFSDHERYDTLKVIGNIYQNPDLLTQNA